MKTIIFILLIGVTSSCVAQKKITNLKNNTIEKGIINRYTIKKDTHGVSLNNIANKFTGITQVSPNMAANETNLFSPLDRKNMLVQLTKICADIITLSQLEELIKIDNSGLLITIKTDIEGKPLELEFYTKTNSILSLNQLENIEKEILQHFTIKLAPYTVNVVKGSNFLKFDFKIYFINILKHKKLQ